MKGRKKMRVYIDVIMLSIWVVIWLNCLGVIVVEIKGGVVLFMDVVVVVLSIIIFILCVCCFMCYNVIVDYF